MRVSGKKREKVMGREEKESSKKIIVSLSGVLKFDDIVFEVFHKMRSHVYVL